MKQHLWMIALLGGMALGGAAGWNVATLRSQHETTFFLDQKAKSDILMRENEAFREYRQGEPESAHRELKRLLDAYAFYADWPEVHPGERLERDAYAIAITHGRLANVCSRLGLTDEARFHLDEAIRHPRIGSVEKLETLLARTDQAQDRQLGILGP